MDNLECKICLEQYDCEERSPRCLSCGHTLCTTCLASIIGRRRLDCPFCRTKHISSVRNATDVSLNYTVISILQEASIKKSRAKSPDVLPDMKKNVSELLASQLVGIRSTITELENFRQCLTEEQSVLELYNLPLKSLATKNEGILQDVIHTGNKLAEAAVKGVEKCLFIEAQKTKVAASTSLIEVTTVLQDDCRSDDKEWNIAAHQLLHSQVLSTAREMNHEVSTTLEALFGGNKSCPLVTPKKVVPRTFQNLDQLYPTPKNQQEGSFPPMALLLLEMIKRATMMGHEVWAVTMVKGCPFHAKMIQVDKHLYLSAFKEGFLPYNKHTVHYDTVRGLMDETCKRIYLELYWAGQVQGRVHIRLMQKGPSVKQFFLLCSGECGQSYVNTCLLGVESRRHRNERVWGGDYEKNNGSGGAALPGLSMGPLSVTRVMAGLVSSFGYDNGHHKPAHFLIYNYDCPDLYDISPIGNVECGLEVVHMASKLACITDATISDCGIVLSQVP